jgi:hypothetical protein
MTTTDKGTTKVRKVRKENKLIVTKRKVQNLKKIQKSLVRLIETVNKGNWDRKSSVLSQISIIRQSLDADLKEQIGIMVDELTK